MGVAEQRRRAWTASGFNVGTEEEILAQVQELAEVGVDYCIFNMPTSGADAVRRAGGLLAGRGRRPDWPSTRPGPSRGQLGRKRA